MTVEQDPTVFYSEEDPSPLLRIGASQIVKKVAAGIFAKNPSELTKEDVLGLLEEGKRQVLKAFDIKATTNADILGVARASLAMEESDLNRTTVEWLERITKAPVDES